MQRPTPSSLTTHNATSAELQETTSLNFPAGQGDITLITIDNVIFHVHRAVLRYSSHVFETIIENGEDASSSPPRLKMEAEASTLDHLLMFAYPNKLSPSIQDVNALAAVFRAAKRYEMDGVLQQPRKSLLEIKIVDDAVEQPLYIKAPLAVLALSYAFDCPVEGRFALRECIKGSLEGHLAGATNFDVPVEVLSEILRLRQGRMSWFAGLVNALPWSHNANYPNCTNCVRKQGEWRGQILHELHTHLRFESFRTRVAGPIGSCRSEHTILQTIAQATLDTWSTAATKMEEALPALPHLSR